MVKVQPNEPAEREVAVSRPRGTTLESFTAFFLGGNPRYVHPEVVTKGGRSRSSRVELSSNPRNSKFGHRTISTGLVHVQFTIATQGRL